MKIFVFAVLFSIFALGDDGLVGNPKNLEEVSGFNPWRYSEGYVAGTLANVRDEGYFVHTLEGQIKLGSTSSVAWDFSNLDQSFVAQLDKYTGDPVVVYFKNYQWVPFVRSPNYLLKLYPVDKTLVADNAEVNLERVYNLPIFRSGTGTMYGKFVMATMDGVVRRHFAVKIRKGGYGNNIVEFNVDDRDMFEFIIKTMVAGKSVNVSFTRIIAPLAGSLKLIRGYDTSYRIYRVQVAD